MSRNYRITVQVDDAFIDEFNGSNGLTQNTLTAAAIEALKDQAIELGTITIVLTDNDEVQTLNHSFLGIDAPTDILSFPNHAERDETMIVDLPPELAAEEAAYLGDLVIAFPYAARQATQHNRTLAEELSLLVVHGTLHLVGYDHVTLEEEAEMWTKQADILDKLGMSVPVESRANSADE